MKAPHHIIERLAADIFARMVSGPHAAAGMDNPKETAEAAFDLAEIFGEESQRRWAAGDTEAAKAALERANGK